MIEKIKQLFSKPKTLLFYCPPTLSKKEQRAVDKLNKLLKETNPHR